ncbi:MAG: helix-turn-helix domain-containing protein [Candidatus Alkaliphilus sp. MAG34]
MKNNIKSILEEKGISIRKLSLGINRAYSNVHELVNKDSLKYTQLNTLVEIAEFLEVDITDLYS